MYILIDLLTRALAAFFAVTMYGYVKALASARLGDPRPGADGRLTLNPIKHTDPLGFFFILIFGYGWGKPVETNPMYYSNRKKSTLIVNILPNLCNIFAGFAFGLAYTFAARASGIPENSAAELIYGIALSMFYSLAVYNVGFALFSFLPVYPMPGWDILMLFLAPKYVVSMQRSRSVFAVLLVLAIAFGLVDTVLSPLTGLILGFMP